MSADFGMGAAPVDAAYPEDVTAVYDLFYRGRGQDFAAEAAAVARIVRAHNVDGRSLLDVACGTGEHLRCLAEHFPDVAGLEMSSAMCAVARGKQPGRPIHQGDMRDFDLGRDFDAVCCLTSSLGYMAGTEELVAAVRVMARHLALGGVLVVDPWWSPAQFIENYVAGDVVRATDRTVARLSHSVRAGDRVRNEAHYLLADPRGVRHFTHVQSLTLFAQQQYLDALADAGLDAKHLPDDVFSVRGLFVGVRR